MCNTISFDKIDTLLFEFEEVLENKFSLKIPVHSNFESLSLEILELQAASQKEIERDDTFDYREKWGKAISLADFLRKVLRVKDSKGFDKLRSHFELLFKDSNILQNLWSPPSDEISNKLFELYLAILVLDKFDHLIDLENPNYSTGNNPDIIFSHGKVRWGIACKVMHTDNPLTYLDSLRKGIDQIQTSDVEIGIVAFNFKNQVDHQKIWPVLDHDKVDGALIYRTYPAFKIAIEKLEAEGDRKFESIKENINGKEHISLLFDDKKALPASLNFYSSVAGVIHGAKPSISLLRLFYLYQFDKITEKNVAVVHQLNEALMDR